MWGVQGGWWGLVGLGSLVFCVQWPLCNERKGEIQIRSHAALALIFSEALHPISLSDIHIVALIGCWFLGVRAIGARKCC